MFQQLDGLTFRASDLEVVDQVKNTRPIARLAIVPHYNMCAPFYRPHQLAHVVLCLKSEVCPKKLRPSNKRSAA